MKASDFIPKHEQTLIVKAIENAELVTSGEIRVHIEAKCQGDPVLRAVSIFEKLKMYETKKRNGVLIYTAYSSCKLAIIGDKGINDVVPEDFWNEIKEKMAADFAEKKYSQGIISAVNSVGSALRQYFPYQDDDVNEQSNEISFGEDEK